MKNEDRSTDFQRNSALEGLIARSNDALRHAEAHLLANEVASLDRPVLFVLGPPRSGSTLFMQCMAASGLFGYLSNLISRFPAAPVMGTLVQQMLFDERFDFRGELRTTVPSIDFTSDLGKTHGPLAPNEAWYFWRRFFDTDKPYGTRITATRDAGLLLKEVAALSAAFDRPMVFKAKAFNWNIGALTAIFPTARFIRVERDPGRTLCSIWSARVRYFGSAGHWYSFEPPEYEELTRMDVHRQIAGQLFSIHRTLDAQLGSMPADRWMRIDYEDLCKDPRGVIDSVARWCGIEAGTLGTLPERFTVPAGGAVPEPDARAMEEAYADFTAGRSTLNT